MSSKENKCFSHSFIIDGTVQLSKLQRNTDSETGIVALEVLHALERDD